MKLYRLLKTLEQGEGEIPVGTLTALSWMKDKHIAILLERRVIAEVKTPPLAALPRWKTRAKRLHRLGIILVADLLEASDEMLIDALGEDDTTVTRWKKQATKWLTVELPRKKC